MISAGTTEPLRHARGSVLILVLAVVLALSLLGLLFLSMGEVNGLDTVRGQHHNQAFHIAEGGLQQAIGRLRVQSAYRQGPTNLNGSLGGGAYVVQVARTGDLYYLTSRSSLRDCTRSIRQVVNVKANGWPEAFAYALFGSNGDINLKKGLSICGDVFDYGNLSMAKDATVSNGMVYATGTITGSGNFTAGALPATLPLQPTLDTTWYEALLAQAALSTNAAPIFPLQLQGQTVYVKGSLTLRDITGPGTLVVLGNITLGQDAYVSPNCTIISGGTLSFAKTGVAGSNNLFYARTGISIAKDGLLLQGCTLLTPGNVDARKTFEMTGLIFAVGTVMIKKDAAVYGSIVGGGVSADMNLTAEYDRSFLPLEPPPGITPVVAVHRVSWHDECIITP
jgi:hypothetical protein